MKALEALKALRKGSSLLAPLSASSASSAF